MSVKRFLYLLAMIYVASQVLVSCRDAGQSASAESESATTASMATQAPRGVRVEVSFEVVPEESYDHVYAEVFLDDEIVGNVGNRKRIDFEVPPGPHRIRLEADGYQSEEKSVKIIQTLAQEFHFRLNQAQPGGED